MSRVYEALRKVGGQAAGIALPALERAGSAGPASGMLAGRGEQTVPGAVSETMAELCLAKLRTATIRAPIETPFPPSGSLKGKASEQYRMIRTKIAMHPRRPRMLAVSSPGAGDGKTISALNIAGSLALNSEVEVLLVDADFRRAGCTRLLGEKAGPGLADVLAGECDLEQAMVRAKPFANLYLLPAGQSRPNATELLDSSRQALVFGTLRERFRFTLFDTPTVGSVADYEVIEAICDGVVFVLRPDHTNRKLAFDTLEMVTPEKLLGVVINEVPPWFLWKTPDDHHDYGGEQG